MAYYWGMTYPEAKSIAQANKSTNLMPLQSYHEGEEVRGLVILQAIFNRVPWMWSYKVADEEGRISEKMEWSL